MVKSKSGRVDIRRGSYIRSTVRSLMGLIRFPLMDRKFIAETVLKDSVRYELSLKDLADLDILCSFGGTDEDALQ